MNKMKLERLITNLKEITGTILGGIGAGIIIGQAIVGVIQINPFDALAFGLMGVMFMGIGVFLTETLTMKKVQES